MENIVVNDELIKSFSELRKKIQELTLQKNKIRNAILEQKDNLSLNQYDIRIEDKDFKDYKAICLHYLNMESIETDKFLKKISYVYIDEKINEVAEQEQFVNDSNIDFDEIVKNAKSKIAFQVEEFTFGEDDTFLELSKWLIHY